MLPEKKKIRKEVNVLFIAPNKVEEYWSLVDFMLREGLKYDGDPMSIKDLKVGVKMTKKFKFLTVICHHQSKNKF